MKNKIVIAIFLMIPALFASGKAQNHLKPDSLQDAFILRSLDFAYADSFDMAFLTIDSLIGINKEYWPAKIIKAGLIYIEMTDDEEYRKQRQFRSLIDSSIAGIEQHLSQYPDDAWAAFFYGTALAYQAVWEGQHGSWLKAITRGLKAGKYFSLSVKLDSNLYDAYLGLGSLHYWRSEKMGFLRKLPFFSDQRQQGIEELKIAVNKSRYSSTAAALALGWIYYETKQYPKVVAISDTLLKSGLVYRQALWLRGLADFNSHNIDEAIGDFAKLKESLLEKGHQNYFNLIACDYYLGVAYYLKGDKITALSHFDEITSYKISANVASRSARRLESAKNYRQKILEGR